MKQYLIEAKQFYERKRYFPCAELLYNSNNFAKSLLWRMIFLSFFFSVCSIYLSYIGVGFNLVALAAALAAVVAVAALAALAAVAALAALAAAVAAVALLAVDKIYCWIVLKKEGLI